MGADASLSFLTLARYPVSAITRNKEELEEISNANPYKEAEGGNGRIFLITTGKRVFVSFLDKEPDSEQREKLGDDYGAPDRYFLKVGLVLCLT